MSRIGRQFGNDLHARLELLQEGSFRFVIQGEGLLRLVIANHEPWRSFVVVSFVNVKCRLAPVHIGRDGDVIGLLDPEFAAQIDDRNLVLMGVFVSQFDLDAIIMLAVTDGAEHPVVDGLVLQQNRHQAIFQSDDVGVVWLSFFADASRCDTTLRHRHLGCENRPFPPVLLPGAWAGISAHCTTGVAGNTSVRGDFLV